MNKNIKPKAVRTLLLDNLIWLLGSSMYAAAVNIFSIPNNITQSGVTGISIIINHLTGYPVGITNFILNVPLFILAGIFLGRGFVAKTLWVTVMVSAELDIFAMFLPSYTGDRLLAALFGGTITGLGLALILSRSATSGGTDIIGRLVRLMFPHLSMGSVIFTLDAAIIVAAALTFRNIESALYAAIVIFFSTRVIDYVLYGMGHGKLLLIVTTKGGEISEAITRELGRGLTVLPVTGGYTGEEKEMLICAVRPSEVAKLTRLVKKSDEKPFIIVAEAGEVLGEGFRHSP